LLQSIVTHFAPNDINRWGDWLYEPLISDRYLQLACRQTLQTDVFVEWFAKHTLTCAPSSSLFFFELPCLHHRLQRSHIAHHQAFPLLFKGHSILLSPPTLLRLRGCVETPFLRAFQPHSDCLRMHLGMLYSSLPVTISGDPGRRLLEISTNAVASAFSVAIFQCRMSETAADSKNNCQKFLTVRSQLTEKQQSRNGSSSRCNKNTGLIFDWPKHMFFVFSFFCFILLRLAQSCDSSPLCSFLLSHFSLNKAFHSLPFRDSINSKVASLSIESCIPKIVANFKIIVVLLTTTITIITND